MSKRVACYARVSTADQSTGLESQIRVLKQYCEQNQIHDVEFFTDEAAELFLAGNSLKANEVQEARRAAARIAALGRAVGMNMIIATQKPDVKAVDGQIKANLTGMLAFPMPNLACSLSILSNGRAAELPPVPGRAIWKNGFEQVEVQTPFMSIEQATAMLAPLKKELVTNVEVDRT